MIEVRRINARFLESPTLGSLFVNADRQTEIIPKYRVTRVGKTIRLESVDMTRKLTFVATPKDNARFVFKKVDA